MEIKFDVMNSDIVDRIDLTQEQLVSIYGVDPEYIDRKVKAGQKRISIKDLTIIVKTAKEKKTFNNKELFEEWDKVCEPLRKYFAKALRTV